MSNLTGASSESLTQDAQPILSYPQATEPRSTVYSSEHTVSFPKADVFSSVTRKMNAHGLPRPLQTLFASYHDQIASSQTGHIPEATIRPIGVDDVPHIADLEDHTESGKRFIKHAVAIKLNGGLGTSMGMTYAKSLIPVRGTKTFLDILVNQAVAHKNEHTETLPLVLMNSFSTEADTMQALHNMQDLPAMPLCFTQHKFPKITQDTLQPVQYPEDPSLEWNPPGHGDIFAALVLSGTLETLLQQGLRYAFISNSDNLGATIDPSLLGYFVDNQLPFLMEVAPRTVNDKKGGHLARKYDGSLVLRELAQCPEADLDFFQDINRYALFNTNNIWVDLQALHNHVRRHGLLRLPMILNPKKVNPRDGSSEPVYQVESAMGAAISCFPGAQAVVTSRNRFIPVKKCCDLLTVMSDCYEETNCQITPASCMQETAPSIALDPAYYTTFDDMLSRFPYGAPSLIQCTSLRITGDVSFGKNITLADDVIITNQTEKQVTIPDGSHIKGIVTF